MIRASTVCGLVIGALLTGAPQLSGQESAERPTLSPPLRVDYLTFAQGAIPIRVGGDGLRLGATFAHALQIIDGDPRPFAIVSRATDETDVEFVYGLPAPTTFDRFAVPNVIETPSPAQTFFERVEVYGSATSADDGYELLAEGTLAAHPRPGESTELALKATTPVRWVRVRLVGGLETLRPQMYLEFGEIIGNGTQEPPPMAESFDGAWRGRGLRLRLEQDGPVVSGCYDEAGVLSGTVTGNILRATGVDRGDQVPSLFIFAVTSDGLLRGVSSTNGAPFRLVEAPRATVEAVGCPDPPPPALGCGAVVHGIQFDLNSAELQAVSDRVLETLAEGLKQDDSPSVTIEGHTSGEGTEAYNQTLSERRAAAVRTDLIRRGVPAARLHAAGAGESRPLASNDDESGRAINRRVEVHCK